MDIQTARLARSGKPATCATAWECHLGDSRGSAQVFDDFGEFVEPVAVAAGELDQLLCPLDDDAAFGRPCNRDTAPASELELVLDRSALVANAANCSCRADRAG